MGCSLIRCNDERYLLLREKYCDERVLCIVTSIAGCVGKGQREKKEREKIY
jgi:hypothetical protein